MRLPDEISIVWCIEDILGQDSTLTKQEAREVLQLLERKHDAGIGINWDVIDCMIDIYKQDKKSIA